MAEIKMTIQERLSEARLEMDVVKTLVETLRSHQLFNNALDAQARTIILKVQAMDNHLVAIEQELKTPVPITLEEKSSPDLVKENEDFLKQYNLK